MRSSAVLAIVLLVVASATCLSAPVDYDVVDRVVQAYNDLGSFSVKLYYSVNLQLRHMEGTGSFAMEVWQSPDYIRVTCSGSEASEGLSWSSQCTTLVTDIAQGIEHCLSPKGEWTTRKARYNHLLDVLPMPSMDELDSIQEGYLDGHPVWILTVAEPDVSMTYSVDRASHFVRKVTGEREFLEQGARIAWVMTIDPPQIGVPEGVFDLDAIASNPGGVR